MRKLIRIRELETRKDAIEQQIKVITAEGELCDDVSKADQDSLDQFMSHNKSHLKKSERDTLTKKLNDVRRALVRYQKYLTTISDTSRPSTSSEKDGNKRRKGGTSETRLTDAADKGPVRSVCKENIRMEDEKTPSIVAEDTGATNTDGPPPVVPNFNLEDTAPANIDLAERESHDEYDYSSFLDGNSLEEVESDEMASGADQESTPVSITETAPRKIYGPTMRPVSRNDTSVRSDDPQTEEWAPPADQTGDGTTPLNKVLGY